VFELTGVLVVDVAVLALVVPMVVVPVPVFPVSILTINSRIEALSEEATFTYRVDGTVFLYITLDRDSIESTTVLSISILKVALPSASVVIVAVLDTTPVPEVMIGFVVIEVVESPIVTV
jgi:hypothetical protein